MDSITDISVQLSSDMNLLAFWICIGLAAVICGVIFYSFYTHRSGNQLQTNPLSKHSSLEFFWTLVPMVILVIMAIPISKAMVERSNTATASAIALHKNQVPYDRK